MAMYEGVVHEIGSGSAYSGGSLGRASRDLIQRSYVRLDDKRIKDVALTRIMDDLLGGAKGERVAMSVAKMGGHNVVAALRLSDGTVEKAEGVGGAIVGTIFQMLYVAFGVALMYVFFGLLIGSAAPIFTLVAPAFALVAVVIYVRTFRRIFSFMGARGAL